MQSKGSVVVVKVVVVTVVVGGGGGVVKLTASKRQPMHGGHDCITSR